MPLSREEREWLEARIARTRTLIERYEDAVDRLSGGALSYTLDTGQTRQTVTRSDLSALRTSLAWLERRLARLKAELRACRGTYARPGF